MNNILFPVDKPQNSIQIILEEKLFNTNILNENITNNDTPEP
jgi:hypothetical protein